MPTTRMVLARSPLLRPARCVAPLVAMALAGPARAESFGVLVRYNAGESLPTTPVVVVLAPDGGAPITLTLLDDGAQPDVTGGDGISAAATSVEGSVFSVTLRVDGTDSDLGKVSWNAVGARDLDIRRTEAGLVATALVSSPGTGPGDAKGPPPGPAGTGRVSSAAEGAPGGAPRAGVEASGGDLSSAPAQAATPGRSVEPRLVFGLAGGLALLLGLLRLWVRSGDTAPRLPRGVSRVGPAGLLGPGTPTLAGTFSIWSVEGDVAAREAAHAALLARVARDHRVLLVAPPERVVAPVSHGPVLRSGATDPVAVAAAVAALSAESGRPVAVVALGLPPDAWEPLEDALPPEVGGIGLPDDAEVPGALTRVHMIPDGDAWTVACGDARVRVRLDADGRAA